MPAVTINNYCEQRKMATLCHAILESVKENPTQQMHLEIHPLDMNEMWNIYLKLVENDVVYSCRFTRKNLSIFNETTREEIKIEWMCNSNRPRWKPYLRFSGGHPCQQ